MAPAHRRVYEEPEPRARADVERALRSDDKSVVASALVGAAFYEPDWRWVQAQCVRLSTHPDEDVRQLTATCLGHLARIHGVLDLDVVEPVLRRMERDAARVVRGAVEDAREDMRMFLGRPHRPAES